MTRRLIVNADDFGRSAGINGGIIRTFEHGIVTSASLMVRWPDAVEAGAYAKQHIDLSVGLHVDLRQMDYKTDTWVWEEVYSVVSVSDEAAVRVEVARQLDLFQMLVGRAPTHLDSHQHVHREDLVRLVLVAVGDDLRIPVRGCSPDALYCGTFYGQSARGWPTPECIAVEALVQIIAELPAGTTELSCHPGLDEGGEGYEPMRSIEAVTLCDPRVREALEAGDVRLCSYHDLVERR